MKKILNKKLYLAHPVNSRKFVRKWELKFEKDNGNILLNPFYDMKRFDIEDLDNKVKKPRKKTPKACVEDDLAMLKKAKGGILAIIDDNIAVGTLQEIVYAKIWGLKVISIILNEKFRNHPWLIYHSDQTFNSIAEFEKWWKNEKNHL
jgi:hypothetical protein